MQPDSPSAARFEDLVTEFNDVDGVVPPRGGAGFGRSALRYRGKIFAMHVRGALVVKLPADRVEALVAAGHGVHFDANKGTPMREWLAVAGDIPDTAVSWSELAAEALAYAERGAKPIKPATPATPTKATKAAKAKRAAG
jgi:hypothetical protein